MHTLVICGTPWCDLKSVEQQLQSVGMAPPRPATGRVVETMDDWHQSLFGRAGTPAKLQAMRPGKAWELAASELFLANWQQTVWGWADARSTWLLDFWRDFDPHTHFILVHTPASEALAHAAAHTHHTPFSASTTLDQWCAHQTELLAFYLRHRDRCTWVQSAQIGNPATWLLPINQQWGLGLQQSSTAPQPPHSPGSPNKLNSNTALNQLLTNLSLQAVAQHQVARDVQNELLATLPVVACEPSLNTQEIEFNALEASDLLHRYTSELHALLNAATVDQAQLQAMLDTEVKARADLQAKLTVESKSKGEVAQQLEVQTQALAQLKRESDKQLQQLQAQQQELTQENELLLAQLHQVQEELERVFLESKDKSMQLDKLTKAKGELKTKLDTEIKSNVSLQAELATAAKTEAELHTRLTAANKAKTQFETELQASHQQLQTAHSQAKSAQNAAIEAQANLQAKLTAETQAKAEIVKESETQAQEIAKLRAANAFLENTRNQLSSEFQVTQQQLQAALEAATKAQVDLQTKLSAENKGKANLQLKLTQLAEDKAELSKQLQHAQNELAELGESGEMQLLQLHQVEEELEHYFLQHQQTQQDLAHSQERLAKWAQRYPHHCEWDSLTTLQATDDQLHLQLRGLQHGSRVLDAFGLQLSASTRSLRLERTGAQGSPLLRWPEGLADPQALVLTLGQTTNRKGTQQTTVQPSAVVSQLSPSDLNLLRALCLNLAEALPQDLPHRAHWVAQCRPWAQALDALPPTWRFDRLNLRHEQVNPDYEHLWFSLDNVQYGARHWPRFEFRLSAANVRKNNFSHLPKLEFPLPEGNANKQFENWFEESEDDKGPKFELRFDTKTPAMDMACWRALNTTDQAQCLALLQHLPRMLALLQSAGATIHRPWVDWQQLATDTQNAVATCLNLPIALLSLPDLSAPHEPRTANI